METKQRLSNAWAQACRNHEMPCHETEAGNIWRVPWEEFVCAMAAEIDELRERSGERSGERHVRCERECHMKREAKRRLREAADRLLKHLEQIKATLPFEYIVDPSVAVA